MRTILVFRGCDAFGQRQNDLWPVKFERPPFTIVLGRLRVFSAQIIQKLAIETGIFCASPRPSKIEASQRSLFGLLLTKRNVASACLYLII